MSIFWDMVPAGSLQRGDDIRAGRVTGAFRDGDRVMLAWRHQYDKDSTGTLVLPVGHRLEAKQYAIFLDAEELLGDGPGFRFREQS